MTPALESSLLRLLRCPRCGATLAATVDDLVCTERGHTFPVIDGVSVLVGDETLAADPQYARQRAYFDAEFAGYDEYRLEHWRVSYLRRLAKAGALGGTGAPLVDVGVGGSGYTVIEAARAGRMAVGCDLSLEALVRSVRFARQSDVADRSLFVCCSAERLPLADASFDVALAIAVLEHVPDDAAAIGELARVLRPGGRAWITVPHELRHVPLPLRPPSRRHDRKLGHLRRYEAEELEEACHRAGFGTRGVMFTGHPIKVAQLGAVALPRRWRDRFWWWCERRDLRRSDRRRGSMQLSFSLQRHDGDAEEESR